MLLNVLVFIVVLVLVLRWQRRRKIWCCDQFKNDLRSVPLIGHAPILFGNAEDKRKVFQAFGREALKQGGVTSLHSWIADQFFAVIADPVVAELVLRNCLEKDDSMKVFDHLFFEGLPVVTVSKWRPRRKTLNPTFAMKHLNQYTDVFRKNSKIFADKLKNVGNEPFSLYECAAALNFDNICETTFGTTPNAQTSENAELTALEKSFHLISERMANPALHNNLVYELTPQFQQLKSIFNKVDAFVRKNTELKYDECKRKIDLINTDDHNEIEKKPKTLQELLIEASKGELSIEYLVRDSWIMLFAGSDTTSVAFSFTCMLLAKYPDIQKKAYQELEDILGDCTRPIEVPDIPKLKYLDAVLKESMRLYPPGMLLLRKIDKDLVLPSGKILVAGTGAMINVWAIHRNPQYWGEDAELFRPERFLDSAPSHPAAYLPFSYGPRNCIGYQYAMMSIKTCLATMLQRYRFLPAGDTLDDQKEEFRTTFDILTRDFNKFHIRVAAR